MAVSGAVSRRDFLADLSDVLLPPASRFCNALSNGGRGYVTRCSEPRIFDQRLETFGLTSSVCDGLKNQMETFAPCAQQEVPYVFWAISIHSVEIKT